MLVKYKQNAPQKEIQRESYTPNRFLPKLMEGIGFFCICAIVSFTVVGAVSVIFPVIIIRIMFIALNISMLIYFIFCFFSDNSMWRILWGIFSIFFLVGLLKFSYMPNIVSRPINFITNHFIGNSVMTEVYYFDHHILGIYKTTGQGMKIGVTDSDKSISWTYVGGFLNEEFDGQGVIKWSTGEQYEGTWSAGIAHGKGKMTFADGHEYFFDWDKIPRKSNEVPNKIL